MRAALNMLVVMVIGITILGCMFKSYRMLGMLENASKYDRQQQEEKSRFQQFSQAQQARENVRVTPPQTSSLKMNLHPFGPRLDIRRLEHPFGPPLNLRLSTAPRPVNYAAAQKQPANGSQAPPAGNSGNPNSPPDSAVSSIMKGWSSYVSTIESLEKD